MNIKNLEKKLYSVGSRPPFLRHEEKIRKKSGLPNRKHYYFFYNSALNKEEDHIILDVLQEENHYDQVEKESIKMPFFITDHSIRVDVPSFNCLLADKLTAFAPDTIGIKYDKDNSIQIIKQLFDIGELFNYMDDLTVIRSTYSGFYKAENSYRKNAFSINEVLNDTISTGLLIAGIGLNKKPVKKSEILKDGIERIQGHLVGCKFGIPQAIIAAGKAVLLAKLILSRANDVTISSLRYNPKKIRDIAGMTISGEWSFLNKLKGTNPEAFFYWYKASMV